MLIKLLASAPIAALMGYISRFLGSVDNAAVERGLIDFVVLGRLPGTEFQISFEMLLLVGFLLFWLPLVFTVYRWARDMIIQKLDIQSYFDAVAL